MAQEPQRTTYTYVDLPELSETFADSLHEMFFDGQMLRLTFTVSRLHLPQQSEANSGKRFPVCRLVLTLPAMLDLSNRLNQLGTTIAQVKSRAQTASNKER
jgi:hypothetical protein